jgi:alkylhydroperoxidase/carboxymuconolactone decarboxylase family protein YurZ
VTEVAHETDHDRYERGLDAYASQFHIPRDEVAGWFAARVGGRFGTESIQSAANAWQDDELSLRDRSLVVLCALIALGGVEPQLRMHTRWAIEHGVTPEQLDAAAALLAIYVGFARASTGLMIVRDELQQRSG